MDDRLREFLIWLAGRYDRPNETEFRHEDTGEVVTISKWLRNIAWNGKYSKYEKDILNTLRENWSCFYAMIRLRDGEVGYFKRLHPEVGAFVCGMFRINKKETVKEFNNSVANMSGHGLKDSPLIITEGYFEQIEQNGKVSHSNYNNDAKIMVKHTDIIRKARNIEKNKLIEESKKRNPTYDTYFDSYGYS